MSAVSVDVGRPAPSVVPGAGGLEHLAELALVALALVLVLGVHATVVQRDRFSAGAMLRYQDAAAPARDPTGRPVVLGFDVAVVVLPFQPDGARSGCARGLQLVVPASWRLASVETMALQDITMDGGRRIWLLARNGETSARVVLNLPALWNTPARLPIRQSVTAALYRVCGPLWRRQDSVRLVSEQG